MCSMLWSAEYWEMVLTCGLVPRTLRARGSVVFAIDTK